VNPAETARSVYEFGAFRLDARRRLLLSRIDGRPVALAAKAIDTLVHLVERAGEVVDKGTLMKAVWPNVRVEENSLSQCVSALRKALGEDPAEHRFIVTAPGRGYRFIADVVAVEAGRGTAAGAMTVAPSRQAARAEPPHAARTLAVLPFKPLAMASDHESLALGMTDALIMRIGGLRNLTVCPLSSVRRYDAADQDPLAAGTALGADCVLDGTLQRSGDRLRVSVRLIDAGSGRQLWADRFDQDFTDIFAIQDAIAERTAAALVVELSNGDRRSLRRHPTDNAQAYQLYVTGWSGLTRPSCSALEKAFGFLELAVARDPGFALAYACLADCYAVYSVFGGGAPHDIFPKALAAVTRALELDPGLAEAHAELGHIRMMYELDLPAAEACCQRALATDPHSTMAHHYLGLLHIARGRLDDALASIRRAQEREPLALNFNANIGMVHYYARRYEEALTQLETTLAMEPGFDHARSLLGRTHLRMGQPQLAIAAFKSRSSTTIGSPADMPCALAAAGRVDEAEEGLLRLVAASREQYVSCFDLATVCAALGRVDESFEWLDRAIGQRAQPVIFLGIDPAFDLLRPDPRFARTLRRLATRADAVLPIR
jgi:TolB-like protein/Tfp pilus assembly protein PilF